MILGNIGEAGTLGESVFTTTISFISGIAGAITVLMLSIFMSIDWLNIKRRFYAMFKGKLQTEIEATFDEIERNIGHWIKGQFFLMLVVGLLSFGGLVLLRIDNPVALALIAGLLEIVPMFGPLIAAIIAALVGLSQSPAKMIMAIALFVFIQQFENNYLVPKVMQKVSGFSPLVILIAVISGSALLGMTGALLAVPALMITVVIVKHLVQYEVE